MKKLTCRKLQSAASQRRAELLHHHYAVLMQRPFQQSDYSHTWRKYVLAFNNSGKSWTTRKWKKIRSPSASVLARLVVRFTVSQVLERKYPHNHLLTSYRDKSRKNLSETECFRQVCTSSKNEWWWWKKLNYASTSLGSSLSRDAQTSFFLATSSKSSIGKSFSPIHLRDITSAANPRSTLGSPPSKTYLA